MTSAEFRARGREMIDFIADYLDSVESRPVLGPVTPGDVLRALPAHPPEQGIAAGADSWEAVFRDLRDTILPNLNHWQHPRFFGFFPANTSHPAILAELLASALATPAFLWVTSPAATELETLVTDWLGEALGLPEPFLSRSGPGGGVIHTTASEASLTALLAARHRARTRAGAGPFHPTLYTSTQAHSSIVKAAMIAGLAHGPDDRTHVRLIDTDADFAMDPGALEAALRADRAAGRTPIYVAATVGTTSSTAIDPLRAITRVVRAESPGAWIHVDGAHAGVAALAPEFRAILDGLELCDSLCVNPHKWLLTTFDCDVFFLRDRAPLIEAMSITPAYLRNEASASGRVLDYRDWQAPLGRRFRALKLWFVMRHYGLEGLRAHIREHVRLAALFEHAVRADPRFEVVTPRTLNLVCFRLTPSPGETPARADARNAELARRLNASGFLYLTSTVLHPPGQPPRTLLRMAIGGAFTQERHVREAWACIQKHASEAQG
ncbi:MAG: aspartate aminotransferase family protein [Phycisphaerales bacterium]|nr:aspartate aminotransferase family protein [Phycisphaerales bacterium]